MRSGSCVLFALALALCGCHTQSADPKPVGSELPIAASHSVALPGATDAADAPHAPAVAESQDATLTTWSDPRSGVRFRYPSVWRPANAGDAIPAPDFTSLAGAPRITQIFLPTGNLYASTTLQSLSFSYTVVPSLGAAACAALPAKIVEALVRTGSASYGGTTYSEASSSDAGMCHQLTATVDTTAGGSECLVFERDFATVCPDTRSSTLPRPLTPRETAALQRHLDAVMQSVQLTSPQ